MVSANIICDSINDKGNRLTTYVLEYQRFIHSELMTHRVFSRNAASSRAIPIDKMIDRVLKNPAMPSEWGMNNTGMQSKSLADHNTQTKAVDIWYNSMYQAVEKAKEMNAIGIHKQIVNRLLEPYSFIQVVLSGTEFDNFFALRTHKDAQPEFQVLAKLMKEEYEKSIPTILEEGEWHRPFINNGEPFAINLWASYKEEYFKGQPFISSETINKIVNQVSAARCTRVSYGLGKREDFDIDKDLALYNRLVSAEPKHTSGLEHTSQNMNDDKQYRNFKGFKQLRVFVEERSI